MNQIKTNHSNAAAERLYLIQHQIQQWLPGPWQLTPASSDASFRRYFRVQNQKDSFIVMDAPPAKENCQIFVKIAQLLLSYQLNVPRVLQINYELGILLLTDFGNTDYLSSLNVDTADALYRDATDSLKKLHVIKPTDQLIHYQKEKLLSEMGLFHEWFLTQYLNHAPNEQQTRVLGEVYQFMAEKALEQPKVIVHRDFHSRNLMLTKDHNPGILDFQDAVIGPITYDLVSLFRDCYIDWPDEKVYGWLEAYYNDLMTEGWSLGELSQFIEWFDFMGVQRHLKCVGIFSRLYIRDGKPGYLKDIPRTFQYILNVLDRYQVLPEFRKYLSKQIAPALRKMTM